MVESISRQLSRPELMNDVGSGIWSTETRTLVRDTVERVVVGRGEIQIVCKDAATAPSSGEPAEDGDSSRVHVVNIPVAQPRSRKEILVPGGQGGPPRRVSHDLVLAIARAKTWMLGLRSGKYADTEDIARAFKLNDAHVRRILRFGYLAPDIVETIADGRQPRSLTVKRLLKGIPTAWQDQRALFGFTN